MVAGIEWAITVVGIFLTMCMFTTLYGKSNVLYSLASESYVGFATGLVVIMSVTFIYRTGILGIMAGDWILAVGIFLGLLTFTRIFPQYGYISRLPIGFSVGAQLALSMRTQIFTGFIRHVSGTIVNLFPGDSQTMLYSWTVVICLIPMLTFFLYTIEMRGPMGMTAKFGEIVLYIAIGAVFAQTFMGRLGMFVGFMQSYTIPPWKIPILVSGMIVVLAIVVVLDRANLIDKWIPE
jgi:hypothetical protein